MRTIDTGQFASCILRAISIREKSWSGKDYTKTIREAVEEITPPEWVEPIYLLVALAWNDAQDWAKEAMNQ